MTASPVWIWLALFTCTIIGGGVGMFLGYSLGRVSGLEFAQKALERIEQENPDD